MNFLLLAHGMQRVELLVHVVIGFWSLCEWFHKILECERAGKNSWVTSILCDLDTDSSVKTLVGKKKKTSTEIIPVRPLSRFHPQSSSLVQSYDQIAHSNSRVRRRIGNKSIRTHQCASHRLKLFAYNTTLLDKRIWAQN